MGGMAMRKEVREKKHTQRGKRRIEHTGEKEAAGMLYVVATPIGNLEDVTLRALRILKEVDLILCEDTRVTGRLLNHYDISKRLVSVNARTEAGRIPSVIKLLREGKRVALVSDAGTPAISDPGAKLVADVRSKMPDVEIIAIPGSSALSAALSVAGLPASEFLFLGFPPHKKGRIKFFKGIAVSKRTVIFYESPHRIVKTLTSLADHLNERAVVMARELTKMHEEVVRGTAEEMLEYLVQNKDKIRGEFVVMVGPV